MSVDKQSQSYVFDFSIHVRTLELIEDVGTEDGRPLNVEEKAKAFLGSSSFQVVLRKPQGLNGLKLAAGALSQSVLSFLERPW
jgi:hypothetical protein